MGFNVAVLHPDLGVGGAERLIVDATVALQTKDHDVAVYTGYHDQTRCFEETINGTVEVITIGRWIPRSIFGRFHAIMAYLKMMFIAIYLSFSAKSYQLILCDQVSACIPIIKLTNLISGSKSRIVFYCHFPDQLLTTRESFIKRIYRLPLDLFEEWSTGLADVILVNSEFTKKTVKRTFKSLKDRDLRVLYPCVDVEKFDGRRPSHEDCQNLKLKHGLLGKKFILLSLNRFERKKELEAAVIQFKRLVYESEPRENSSYHLIVAGGYDSRLEECVSYFSDLVDLTNDDVLHEKVTFLKSPSDMEKLILLEICDALVYTPQNEHFGIVPIEAMAMRRPVIACASGGPLETIEHGKNGYLCSHDEMYRYMKQLATRPEIRSQMGENGFRRAIDRFSFATFRDQLNQLCFGV